MDKRELLKQEIAERQIELKKLEREEADKMIAEVIKPLSGYTDEEKIKKFDHLYEIAKEMLKDAVESGDAVHFSYVYSTWEEVMELISYDKKSLWKYYLKKCE